MVKEWLKSRLNDAGWDLVRYANIPERPFRVLPYVVAERLERDEKFFFVQIGANDGMFDDPLHDLVLRYSLRGLLVEPLPHLFERLRATYAGRQGLIFERCAIGPIDGEMSLYCVRPDAPVPNWVHAIASCNRSHLTEARFGVPALETHVEEVRVPALTLKTLLARHGIDELTLLQTDTEGLDCEIVNMALDAGFRPAIINYEFIHATLPARAACKKRLAEVGYTFIDVGRDTLAVRR